MKPVTYKIIYKNNDEINEFKCSNFSLERTTKHFLVKGYEIISVTKLELNKAIKPPKDLNEVKKQRVYKNKYTSYYKKLKNGKITEEEFRKIKEVLKDLKRKCKTVIEFENDFNSYINRNRMFGTYFNRIDKEYIIGEIKKDILNKYYNITILELDILSKNIYEYCCLKINKISKKEIITYILEMNNKIYDELTGKEIDSMTVDFNLKFLKLLIDKYSKLLIKSKNNRN